MKKNGKKQASEGKIGVVLEQIDSKLDFVVEGQEALGSRIEQVDHKIDNLGKEMDYKFGVVLDELGLIRNELKEKVGRDEFIVLEKRVSQLEKKVSHSEK